MKTKITIKTLFFIVVTVLFVVPHPIYAAPDVTTGLPQSQVSPTMLEPIIRVNTGANILWDTYHGIYLDYSPSGRFSNLKSLLESKGYTVDENSSGILNLDLNNYDIVVICLGSAWDSGYSAGEVTALENFVTTGGGLLIMGDNEITPNSNINPISQAFGTTLGIADISPVDTYITNMTVHRIFQGVSEIYMRAAGEISGTSPSSEEAWADTGQAVVTVAGSGSGRIVAMGDINIMAEYLSTSDNQLFSENVFDWLVLTDTDGDGLLDDWEINGYDHDGDGIIDVDLPAMGADPNHKDIFVEVDWMVGTDHNHKPMGKAIRKVVRAFERAKVSNPDGTTGITLHVDRGNLGGGNALPHDNDLNPVWTEFDALKSANFAPEREPIFHYCIFAHNYSGGTSSGLSRGIPASDFIVSLGSWTNQVGTMKQQAGTFMHELGHNLGLRHGGNDHEHYKPNFLSIMSYSFQMDWLRFKGEDRKLDYSKFDIEDLDENHLNERRGLDLVGRDRPIRYYGTRWFDPSGIRRITNKAKSRVDWDWDGDPTETDVAVDINGRNGLSILTGHCVEWDNIVYDGGSIGPGFRASEVPEVFEELTLEEYRRMKELSIESD